MKKLTLMVIFLRLLVRIKQSILRVVTRVRLESRLWLHDFIQFILRIAHDLWNIEQVIFTLNRISKVIHHQLTRTVDDVLLYFILHHLHVTSQSEGLCAMWTIHCLHARPLPTPPKHWEMKFLATNVVRIQVLATKLVKIQFLATNVVRIHWSWLVML